ADGGRTWANMGLHLPANTNFSTTPQILNTQTYIVGTNGWGSGTNGIYKTTDGGVTWFLKSSQAPVTSIGPLQASDGTIYWSAGGSLLNSTNAGDTWGSVGSGLTGVNVIQLPDGRLASVGSTNLLVSSNGGSSWVPLGPPLPYTVYPTAAGLIYSTGQQ